MIKKILCPVDFSPASLNAAEYAAKLSQVLNAEYILVNVQILTLALPGFAGNKDYPENVLAAEERLKELCAEANKLFRITAKYEVSVSAGSWIKTMPLTDQDTLIVMGTNGADDIWQQVFGTNAYKVTRKARCPVWIVPEHLTYGTPKKILFAWDYSAKNMFAFTTLKELMKGFDPRFLFLHISTHHTETSRELFSVFRNRMCGPAAEDGEFQFKQIFDKNIRETLDEYMRESQSDLLALAFYEQKQAHTFFEPGLIKQVVKKASYPVLVLHV